MTPKTTKDTEPCPQCFGRGFMTYWGTTYEKCWHCWGHKVVLKSRPATPPTLR